MMECDNATIQHYVIAVFCYSGTAVLTYPCKAVDWAHLLLRREAVGYFDKIPVCGPTGDGRSPTTIWRLARARFLSHSSRRIMSASATASNAPTVPEDWSLADAVALRARVESNRASTDEQEMWRRVRNRFEAKYRRGNLSDRSARQLGLIG